MAFGFGSTSSASSSSSGSFSPSGAPAAPTREQRKACWDSRDLYYDCLTSHKIIRPGDEAKGADGEAKKNGGNICKAERDSFHKNCGQSWIDYFNQRRVLEFRQKATMEKAAQISAASEAKR